jgi:hypothetical protein
MLQATRRIHRPVHFSNIHQYVWPSPLTKEETFFGKLAKNRVKYRTSLLFDLEQDPSESYNLIDNFPDVARDLDGMMSEWESACRRTRGAGLRVSVPSISGNRIVRGRAIFLRWDGHHYVMPS